LLSTLTHESMTNEDFPYLHAREIDIDYARVYAVRVTYLGELGWELYIPTENAVAVYDRIIEAGAEFGLRHAGLQALTSLRLEKAYRDYGHDIDNMDTPIETGLGFAVKLDKPGGFIGRDVLAEKKAAMPLNNRLVMFQLDDPEPLLFHGEVLWRDGLRVGYIRAGGYGFTLGSAIGLGMVETDEPVTKSYLEAGQWEIEINGKKHSAKASLRPLSDPQLKRVKA
jgi:4-methylaminobutanoate oxidase (formaldehyde-forming)